MDWPRPSLTSWLAAAASSRCCQHCWKESLYYCPPLQLCARLRWSVPCPKSCQTANIPLWRWACLISNETFLFVEPKANRWTLSLVKLIVCCSTRYTWILCWTSRCGRTRPPSWTASPTSPYPENLLSRLENSLLLIGVAHFYNWSIRIQDTCDLQHIQVF